MKYLNSFIYFSIIVIFVSASCKDDYYKGVKTTEKEKSGQNEEKTEQQEIKELKKEIEDIKKYSLQKEVEAYNLQAQNKTNREKRK